MFVLQIDVLFLNHTIFLGEIFVLLKQFIVPLTLFFQQFLQLIVVGLQLLNLFSQLLNDTYWPHDVTLCNFVIVVPHSPVLLLVAIGLF